MFHSRARPYRCDARARLSRARLEFVVDSSSQATRSRVWNAYVPNTVTALNRPSDLVYDKRAEQIMSRASRTATVPARELRVVRNARGLPDRVFAVSFARLHDANRVTLDHRCCTFRLTQTKSASTYGDDTCVAYASSPFLTLVLRRPLSRRLRSPTVGRATSRDRADDRGCVRRSKLSRPTPPANGRGVGQRR